MSRKQVFVAVFVLLVQLVALTNAGHKQAQFAPGQGPNPYQPLDLLESQHYMAELSPSGVEVKYQEGEDVSFTTLCQSDDDCAAITERKQGGVGHRLLGEHHFVDPSDDEDLDVTAVKRERMLNGVTMSGRRSRIKNKNHKGGKRKFRTRRGGGRAVLGVKFRGGRRLQCDPNGCADVLTGDSCTLKCRFIENSGDVCDDCEATVTFETQDGQVVVGETDGNGWVSGEITVSDKGPVTITGTNNFGDTRTRVIYVSPSNPLFSGVTSASMQMTGDPEEVALTLHLAVLDDEHLHHSGVVRATVVDADGNAFVEVSSMSEYTDDGSVTVLIQPEWFANHAGPYTLTNVAVRCPDDHNTLVSADELEVLVPSGFHPATHHHLSSFKARAETNKEREERVTMGRRPSHEELEAFWSRQHERDENRKRLMEHKYPSKHHNALQGGGCSSSSPSSTYANGRDHSSGIILIHGYCAGGNPWPTSDFSNSYGVDVFLNPCQSISHNTFAKRIGVFGSKLKSSSTDPFGSGTHWSNPKPSNLKSCGIIAHSQGGAASVQLYANYWSCLDNAASTGSYMVQTVGTPYKGTALAGNLATFGNWFGVGCGAVNDLTESGGNSWHNNLPSWAGGIARYYRTTYIDRSWYCGDDYCDWFTDFALSGQEDGTVEVGRSTLSGATNGGVQTGQCHTSGMRHNQQTTNGRDKKDGCSSSKAGSNINRNAVMRDASRK